MTDRDDFPAWAHLGLHRRRAAEHTLRATQVYRRESVEWKVAHRHGDTVIE